jgi:diguanylate cyclase (GGDEF)-like protein
VSRLEVILAALAAISVMAGGLLAWRVFALGRQVHALTGGAVDPLTGLANREGFHAALGRSARECSVTQRDLSLAVIEINGLDAFTAQRGALSADRVRYELGQFLSRHARSRDTVARVGEAEFAWVLPDTDRRTAHRVISRATAALPNESNRDLSGISLSVGVSDLTRAGTAERIYPRAIDALQVAKTRRVSPVTAEPPQMDVPGSELSRRPMQRVQTMARDVDSRDGGSEHSQRVADLAARIAGQLAWSPEDVARLRDAALVHDVGKYAIDTSVVGKHSELDAGEREIVERHPVEGAAIAGEVLDDDQAAWIRHHHERWDGTGYPAGLGENDIPSGAAIIAVAEAWDVIISGRSYQLAREPDDAWQELRRGAGTQWSPEAVAALERALAELGR